MESWTIFITNLFTAVFDTAFRINSFSFEKGKLNIFCKVLSRDSVTVTVDAVVYYRVSNPTMATNNVEDFRLDETSLFFIRTKILTIQIYFSHSTHLLAATTLRNVLGTKHLAEILSERETISHVMEQTLDEATDPWGVKVERVEM